MQKTFKDIIDKLKEIGRLEITMHGGRCNGKTLALGYAKGIENAIDIVNQANEEYNNGWIPCGERLPEEDGWYYTTERCGSAVESGMCKFVNGEWEHIASCIKTIAWRERPEPYKGE